MAFLLKMTVCCSLFWLCSFIHPPPGPAPQEIFRGVQLSAWSSILQSSWPSHMHSRGVLSCGHFTYSSFCIAEVNEVINPEFVKWTCPTQNFGAAHFHFQGYQTEYFFLIWAANSTRVAVTCGLACLCTGSKPFL